MDEYAEHRAFTVREYRSHVVGAALCLLEIVRQGREAVRDVSPPGMTAEQRATRERVYASMRARSEAAARRLTDDGVAAALFAVPAPDCRRWAYFDPFERIAASPALLARYRDVADLARMGLPGARDGRDLLRASTKRRAPPAWFGEPNLRAQFGDAYLGTEDAPVAPRPPVNPKVLETMLAGDSRARAERILRDMGVERNTYADGDSEGEEEVSFEAVGFDRFEGTRRGFDALAALRADGELARFMREVRACAARSEDARVYRLVRYLEALRDCMSVILRERALYGEAAKPQGRYDEALWNEKRLARSNAVLSAGLETRYSGVRHTSAFHDMVRFYASVRDDPRATGDVRRAMSELALARSRDLPFVRPVFSRARLVMLSQTATADRKYAVQQAIRAHEVKVTRFRGDVKVLSEVEWAPPEHADRDLKILAFTYETPGGDTPAVEQIAKVAYLCASGGDRLVRSLWKVMQERGARLDEPVEGPFAEPALRHAQAQIQNFAKLPRDAEKSVSYAKQRVFDARVAYETRAYAESLRRLGVHRRRVGPALDLAERWRQHVRRKYALAGFGENATLQDVFRGFKLAHTESLNATTAEMQEIDAELKLNAELLAEMEADLAAQMPLTGGAGDAFVPTWIAAGEPPDDWDPSRPPQKGWNPNKYARVDDWKPGRRPPQVPFAFVPGIDWDAVGIAPPAAAVAQPKRQRADETPLEGAMARLALA